MLSFAAEFPVHSDGDADRFFRTVFDWISGSPHSTVTYPDLERLRVEGHNVLRTDSDVFESIVHNDKDDHLIAFKRITNEKLIQWETIVVLNKYGQETWVGVRTSRVSDTPLNQLPPAKKPIIVRSIIDALGPAVDGVLTVQGQPHQLRNDEINLAINLVTDNSGCYLPIVFVSCGFDGNYAVDSFALANDLAGMAHVIIEPNRAFSRRLQIDVGSSNVYGGAIGIYWPDQGGHRGLFLSRDFVSPHALKKAIVEAVRTALTNRRPLDICSWLYAEEINSKTHIATLKKLGSKEIDDYVSAFDKELNSKDERLLQAESEIRRLKDANKALEKRNAGFRPLSSTSSSETDLYPGEISCIVTDALNDAMARTLPGSRRHDVLSSVVASFGSNTALADRRSEIKELLRDYRSLDGKTRRSLESFGFSISEEGKHYKLVFQDDRYVFSLPKSGSDWRGGMNMVSDIAGKLF